MMKRMLTCLLSLLLLSVAFAENTPLTIAIPGREGDVIDYMLALMSLGADPVVVWDEDYAPEDFDGLLLPGGVDIHPARYGQENIACEWTDTELDAVQFRAAERFVEAGIPILGICRGHQLLNVLFGGTLIQHLDNAQAHVRLDDQDNIHATTVAPQSFLAALYGEAVTVNSAHHQAVDRLAEDMQAVQWCGEVIEAMQHRTLPVYSVQWHPERMGFDAAREDTAEGSLVLAWFLEVCRAHQ